jgi:hypothetical protein
MLFRVTAMRGGRVIALSAACYLGSFFILGEDEGSQSKVKKEDSYNEEAETKWLHLVDMPSTRTG